MRYDTNWNPKKVEEQFFSIEDLSINLLCTRQCNYACGHCMYAASRKLPGEYMTFQDLYAIRSLIEEVYQAFQNRDITPPIISINLVGGEPTLNLKKFREITEIIERWKDVNVEMTTNGWWLRSWETTLRFAKAVQMLIYSENFSIRISNSQFHTTERKKEGEILKGHSPTKNLLEHLEEGPHPQPICPHCAENIIVPGKCNHCEEYIEEGECHYDTYSTEIRYGALQTLIEAIEKGTMYVESSSGLDKVSPVGRGRKINGFQDGHCHPIQSSKLTFIPARMGEKPAPLYDACCNGGKIPLGHAEEGIGLLIKRILWIEALHKAIPLPKENGYNPGRGKRCYGCKTQAEQWLPFAKAHGLDQFAENVRYQTLNQQPLELESI